MVPIRFDLDLFPGHNSRGWACHTSHAQEQGEAAIETRTKRILIVDDDQNICNILSHRLRALDSDVETVGTAMGARRAVAQKTFDFILLDIMMPHFDGFSGIAMIRQARPKEKIPVLIMTARRDPKDEERAAKAGAVGLILKPFNFPSLVKTICKTLKLPVPEARQQPDPTSDELR